MTIIVLLLGCLLYSYLLFRFSKAIDEGINELEEVMLEMDRYEMDVALKNNDMSES